MCCNRGRRWRQHKRWVGLWQLRHHLRAPRRCDNILRRIWRQRERLGRGVNLHSDPRSAAGLDSLGWLLDAANSPAEARFRAAQREVHIDCIAADTYDAARVRLVYIHHSSLKSGVVWDGCRCAEQSFLAPLFLFRFCGRGGPP